MNLVFQDTFEDTDEKKLSLHTPTPLGGSLWLVSGVGANNLKIDTAEHFSGNSSLRGCTDSTAEKRFISVNEILILNFKMKTTGTANFFVAMGLNGTTRSGPQWQFANTAILQYFDHNVFKSSGWSITVGVWHEFRMTIDVPNSHWSLEGNIGGGWFTIITNAGFYDAFVYPTNTLTQIVIAHPNTVDMWWDDITLESAIVTSYLKLDGTTWADATKAKTKLGGDVFA
jgi:hypothetical protein